MDTRELLMMNLADFRRMESLAEEQESKLAVGDAKGFFRASGRRDALQEEIQKRSEKIRGLLRRGARGPEDKRLLELEKEIQEAASRLMEANKRIRALAEDKRNEALQDVMQLKQGRQGLRGYAKRPGRVPPRFLDRKG